MKLYAGTTEQFRAVANWQDSLMARSMFGSLPIITLPIEIWMMNRIGGVMTLSRY